MSAPNDDRTPTTPTSTSTGRGRRPLGLLVAACLVVAGAAVGTTVALAGRTSGPAAAAGTGQVTTAQPAGGGAVTANGEGKDDAESNGQDTGQAKAKAHETADTAAGAAVLPDGVHHTLIRRVDIANDRITVDVVQLFLDGDAVKAALADGKPRDQAEVLSVYLRNQNPRLRTLPLAGDLKVDLHGSCEENTDRRALLEQLAGNLRLGLYFHTLTVRDGVVHAIKERQIQPAC
jgi:hypothetical protein